MYGPQVHQLNIGGNTSKLQSSPPFLLFQCPASGDSRQKGFTTFPYSHKPPLNISNSVSDRDFSNFNTYLQDGSPPGFESPLRAPRLVKSQGAATNQLHQHLEDCCKQLKLLEKERKKEILNISCLPKGTLLAGSSPLPKIPPNPSRVDRLIVDQLREQSRVASLLGRMECLCGFPLHANIFSKLLNHQEAIHVTQAGRRMELIANRQGGAILRENKDVMQLAVALRDLCVVTRKCCLALWCALQKTISSSNSTFVPRNRTMLDAIK
uniref:Uncharacterized protein n=1 Tax=Denticeps clupeoides TaxID=299321 RepID=A0AAY4CFB7_9TELE